MPSPDVCAVLCVLGKEAVELGDNSNGHRRAELPHEKRLGHLGLEGRGRNGNEIRVKIIQK